MTTTNERPPAVDPRSPEGAEARRQERLAITTGVKATYRHETGVAFGPHPRQVLDIYYPNNVTTAAPVLVFLHGGGFRQGEPGSSGYVGAPYLAHGCIYVAMGYRLLPDARFPDSADDVEAGLQWLYENLPARGGDVSRIFLTGHSAGAFLAAIVSLQNWRTATGLPADLIKGAVLLSGMYDFTRHPDEMMNRSAARYVPNLSHAIERLPSNVILVEGDDDNPLVPPANDAMLGAIKARGGAVERFVEPNADHFAATRSFVADGGIVFEATRRMMAVD